MQTMTRWMTAALVLGLGCGGAQVEPPDDSESQGNDQTTNDVSATGTGTDTSASATEVGSTDETTTAPTTTTDDPTTDATTTDTGGEACIGPDGCFDCAPQKPLEFLNACTDAACSPFANTQERLPLLEGDGTLPPLP